MAKGEVELTSNGENSLLGVEDVVDVVAKGVRVNLIGLQTNVESNEESEH